MFRTILEKELRDLVSSVKFALTFGVCALLILLTFYVGARNYHLSQSQYEAAKMENVRQMEGLTDWLAVRNYRIFLPPEPVATLVTGISNDIGRTVEVEGRGELTAQDSKFNEDPIYATFRFLDLDFVFQIVLSLFAILFAYEAVNGEKEHGTLRLVFSNAVSRVSFILGKIVGSFLGLSVPLIVAILLGCLLLPIMRVPMASDDWLRLTLVVFAGLLYFGAFLTLAVLMSALTHRSANAFLMLLVIWILAVAIIPRSSVLLAARAVEVPTVDEIAAQKTRFASQLWQEDHQKIAAFTPAKKGNAEEMLGEFQKLMQELADAREQKILEFASRLNEERRNRQEQQERLAFNLARISPAAAFSLAITSLAGTSLQLKQHFLDEAQAYQRAYASFIQEKTGINPGGGMILMRISDDGETPKPIDPRELPEFHYQRQSLDRVLSAAFVDLGILAMFNLAFFAGAFLAFLRYDVR